MAVLKRFSYDNIVEHNPTAPDPVEGGGGSGGGSGIFLIKVTATSNNDATSDKTFDEIAAAYNEGKLPVAHILMRSELGDMIHIATAYFTSYNAEDREIGFDSIPDIQVYDPTHLMAFTFHIIIGFRGTNIRSGGWQISGTKTG